MSLDAPRCGSEMDHGCGVKSGLGQNRSLRTPARRFLQQQRWFAKPKGCKLAANKSHFQASQTTLSMVNHHPDVVRMLCPTLNVLSTHKTMKSVETWCPQRVL